MSKRWAELAEVPAAQLGSLAATTAELEVALEPFLEEVPWFGVEASSGRRPQAASVASAAWAIAGGMPSFAATGWEETASQVEALAVVLSTKNRAVAPMAAWAVENCRGVAFLRLAVQPEHPGLFHTCPAFSVVKFK